VNSSIIECWTLDCLRVRSRIALADGDALWSPAIRPISFNLIDPHKEQLGRSERYLKELSKLAVQRTFSPAGPRRNNEQGRAEGIGKVANSSKSAITNEEATMAGDRELKKTRGTKKVRKASKKRRRKKISKSRTPKI
jgi:hypothetical protein